jgi:hypothetical protein
VLSQSRFLDIRSRNRPSYERQEKVLSQSHFLGVWEEVHTVQFQVDMSNNWDSLRVGALPIVS